MARTPTTYWDYIQVEQLLSLQRGLGTDDAELSNDEVMFITIHQIDELWFKLAIRELVSIRDLMKSERVPEQALSEAVRGIRRAAQLFGHVANHFSLMETLTTRDYLAFRDKLYPASGFQSAQLREIEILLGLPEDERIPLGHESYLAALRHADGSESPASRRVAARLEDKPSLRDALWRWIHRTPIDGSTPDQPDDDERVRAFIERYLASHAATVARTRAHATEDALTQQDRERIAERYDREVANARAYFLAEDLGDDVDEATRAHRSRIRAAIAFIESYRELPLLAWPREIIDSIVMLEQSFTIFRQRHARMVERIIGRRTGTGGSAGVDYLDQTALKYRIFRDVWAVRTLLLRRDALPELEQAEYYDFREAT